MKALEDYYIIQNGKKLQYGYTTGSCAAAAAKAAAVFLLEEKESVQVTLLTPFGISLELPVLHLCRKGQTVQCAIQKYAGDDPDVTNGIEIFAKVEKMDDKQSKPGENLIVIDGGTGVGRITKPGLEQPVGNAAINRVPREMITREVQAVCKEAGYTGEIRVMIEVPQGEILAKKTFNPRLGIVGGISILGTSGIVIPMSEEALIKSIESEMKLRLAEGTNCLYISPGNYGENFIREHLQMDAAKTIHCSNYVGKTIDMAVNLGVEEIWFVAHIGKFIKVAGGIMDTHSRSADCRAELMSSFAILAGADLVTAKRILSTVTTEESVQILKEAGLLEKTMEIIMKKIKYYLDHRANGSIKMHAIVFSSVEGYLGSTEENRK